MPQVVPEFKQWKKQSSKKKTKLPRVAGHPGCHFSRPLDERCLRFIFARMLLSVRWSHLSNCGKWRRQLC